MNRVEFDISVDRYVVRLAEASDARAVRMLLPHLPDPGIAFVAIDGRQGLVIGAIAAGRLFRRQPLAGPGIGLSLIPPCRRQSVARELLRHLEQAVAACGARGLYGARRCEDASDEFRGWCDLGFSPCERVEEHLLPLAEFEPRLAPLMERFRRSNRIPVTARIVPLYESNLADVLQLHLDHLGGDRGDLYRKLRSEGQGAFHPRYSRVLVIGGRVKGCILAHRADRETASVDANIVSADLRGGWANVWLKLEATRGAQSLGIKNFRFTTFDHYRDTRGFTEKLGGVTTRRTLLMMRPIGSTAPSSIPS